MIMAKKKHSQASAAVVDGNLIISLPDAIDPVVWRMALGDARASALEVKQRDDKYVLVLKTPRGDVNDIAPFAEKQTALNALMCVADAMQSAEGKINPAAPLAQGKPAGQAPTAISAIAGLKWAGAFMLVCLAVFMFTRMSGTALTTYNDGSSPANATLMPGNKAGNNSQSNGVPVSADDMLSGF